MHPTSDGFHCRPLVELETTVASGETFVTVGTIAKLCKATQHLKLSMAIQNWACRGKNTTIRRH